MEGKVYSYGKSNHYGIMGRGNEAISREVNQLQALQNEFVVDVLIHTNHCLALTDKG